MIPVGEYFFRSVISAVLVIVGILCMLGSTILLNQRWDRDDSLGKVGAWALIVLAVLWPVSVLVLPVLYGGIVLSLAVAPKSSESAFSGWAIAILGVLGSAASAVYFWCQYHEAADLW